MSLGVDVAMAVAVAWAANYSQAIFRGAFFSERCGAFFAVHLLRSIFGG